MTITQAAEAAVSTPGFHAECWRIISGTTALYGVRVEYLPAGEPVCENARRLVECPMCGDRWLVPWSWVRHVPVLRRALLGLLVGGQVGCRVS